jgi:hypothetical protein
MRRGDIEELIGLLAGELPAGAAQALRERLAREPELAAALRRLEAVWQAAEPPPAGAVPPGFARVVMDRVRRDAEGPAPLSWSLAPVWVRAAGAAALAAGVLLGAGAGTLRPLEPGGAWASGGRRVAANGGGGDRVASGIEAPAGGEEPGNGGPDRGGRAEAPAHGGGDGEAPGLLAPSLAEEYLEAVGGEGGGAADPLAGWGAS